MWSVLPGRFIELVELGTPRSLAMVLVVLGCMKLVEGEVEWFRGIAARQIPDLMKLIPPAWLGMCAWPVRVVEGDVGSEPVETTIDGFGEGELEVDGC